MRVADIYRAWLFAQLYAIDVGYVIGLALLVIGFIVATVREGRQRQ